MLRPWVCMFPQKSFFQLFKNMFFQLSYMNSTMLQGGSRHLAMEHHQLRKLRRDSLDLLATLFLQSNFFLVPAGFGLIVGRRVWQSIPSRSSAYFTIVVQSTSHCLLPLQDDWPWQTMHQEEAGDRESPRAGKRLQETTGLD